MGLWGILGSLKNSRPVAMGKIFNEELKNFITVWFSSGLVCRPIQSIWWNINQGTLDG